MGNAKGRSEMGRGKTRHKQQNEREAKTMEMIKQIGMKLKRKMVINDNVEMVEKGDERRRNKLC